MQKNKNGKKTGKRGTPLNIVIVASPRARSNPHSFLLRLSRDYASILRRFLIHSTAGTSQIILGTGLYEPTDVISYLAGPDGGIAELAALVARGECAAVILLLDPGDPWSDAVENRALKRVSIQQQVRLITTYAAAERWLTYEAVPALESRSLGPDTPPKKWRPVGWQPGHSNVTIRSDYKHLTVNQRSVALVSHDKKKREMVEFVKNHTDLLSEHHRILTTGTTGWLLKLMFAGGNQQAGYLKEIKKAGKEGRLSNVIADLLSESGLAEQRHADLDKLLERARSQFKIIPARKLTSKIMPLPSGPEGGDVLMAHEVLMHKCHTIVFFHDPMTAHPHNDDIRLLEHTSQLPGVFAECVSDRRSADEWAKGLREEIGERPEKQSLAQQLRQVYNLREAILVDSLSDKDSESLGRALARVCAGYLNQQIINLARIKKDIHIGVAWGWGTKAVLEELVVMERDGLIEKPSRYSANLTWSPLIGIITAEITDREASTLAHGFRDFYGGQVDGFSCAGFSRSGSRQTEDVAQVIAELEEADLILTSASPWDKEAALYKNTGLDPQYFPKFEDSVGMLSGVFLDRGGREVRGKYSIVGLGYSGFREAAQKNTVLLMCGGSNRRAIVLATLRGQLVSELVTTRATAKWLLKQERIEKV